MHFPSPPPPPLSSEAKRGAKWRGSRGGAGAAGTCRGAGAAARCGVSPVRGRGRWLGFGRRCEKVELLPGGAGGDGGSRSFCAECQTFPWLPFLHPRHPFPLPRTHMHTPPANGLLGVRVCVCGCVCVWVCVSQPSLTPTAAAPGAGHSPGHREVFGEAFCSVKSSSAHPRTRQQHAHCAEIGHTRPLHSWHFPLDYRPCLLLQDPLCAFNRSISP